jgi:uncharacterized protein YpmB
MATWRIWFWSTFAVLVLGAVALLSAIWNNLSSAWDIEARAAQVALDQSPLDHIQAHDVFTADGVQEVFEGVDAFGRKWYAFVYGSPFVVQAVPDSALTAKDRVLKSAMQQLHIHPREIHLGYLDDNQQARFHTTTDVVYEVVGDTPSGNTEYVYFDARTGKFIWKYMLST